MVVLCRNNLPSRLTPLVAALGFALSGPLCAADVLTGLGTLGGTNSYGQGISADGSAVVGYSDTRSDAASHAFRLTGSGMSDLGTLGGRDSQAYGVSADGGVVVGQSRYAVGNSTVHAFRWTTAARMMNDLGTLGGANSIAYGVSGDGAVVVGYSYLVGNANYHAFRWTTAAGPNGGGTMSDLGTLGGTYSYATAASGDGSVVVGSSYIAGNTAIHPFRWVNGASGGVLGNTQMSNLGTLGGSSGGASGVSADGSVVVGYSSTVGDTATHAFRWTTAVGSNGGGTMIDLGTLAGKTSSDARAVSADGKVVVGSSYVTHPVHGSTSQYEAFRWTQATHMQAVAAWLTGAGVTVPVGVTLEKASGVNADGTVVVGTTTNAAGKQEAWLARVGITGTPGTPSTPSTPNTPGTGLLTNTAAYEESLSQSGSSTGWVITGPMFGMVTSGGHHRSLLDNGLVRTQADGSCVWATADAGRQNKSDTRVEMAEAGVCRDMGSTRLGLGVGWVQARQGWGLNGSARLDGQYFIAEIDRAFDNGLEVSVLGLYGRLNTHLSRHYMNGASVDSSRASPNATSIAVRLRLDWKNAAQLAAFSLSPYVAYTWMETKLDAYTETGGGFPAAFNASTWRSNGSRLGASAKTVLSTSSELTLSLEAVHRFEGNGSGSSGQVIGLGSFSMPGQALKQDWARAIVDLDHRLSRNSLISLSANGATTGGDASWGVSLGYRMAF